MVFLAFLEDSGMLVWYSMLNTIPETAQASHSRKCSNNTEYGKVHFDLARSVFDTLETVSMIQLFKVVFWHIDMQYSVGLELMSTLEYLIITSETKHVMHVISTECLYRIKHVAPRCDKNRGNTLYIS